MLSSSIELTTFNLKEIENKISDLKKKSVTGIGDSSSIKLNEIIVNHGLTHIYVYVKVIGTNWLIGKHK